MCKESDDGCEVLFSRQIYNSGVRKDSRYKPLPVVQRKQHTARGNVNSDRRAVHACPGIYLKQNHMTRGM